MKEVFAIGFSLTKTWSYNAKKEAIERAGSFDAFLEKNKSEIEAAIDLKTSENQFKKLQKLDGWLWIYGDENYPQALAKIPNPPLLIYGIGNPRQDEKNLLAMIGTRQPTPYGKRIAILLAKDLVREGLTLVSGLARGIDSIAHKVSIDANVPTLAVVAHGLDMTYPPENRKMREEILATGGAIISEYPFGIKPLRGYFDQRNRIISGLCLGTLVIEAGEKSGTRLTVNHALEQAREVFAVPGPIDSEYSIYTNELIFNGANMVRTSDDILTFYSQRTKREYENKSDKNVFKPNRLQRQILAFLDQDIPKAMDDFFAGSPAKPQEVIQSLTELELHGKVFKQPNAMYIRSPA